MTREAKQIERLHTAGGAVVLGVVLALSLIGLSIARHPASIQGAGRGLLLTDIGLLLVYGIAGICVWYQHRDDVSIAFRAGTLTGLVLSTVHVANHVIESFVPNRHFALIISPVLLMFALFGQVLLRGSARGRSRWR